MTQPPFSLWDRIAVVLATGFGVGRVPWFPGTVGSLWGLPIVWGLDQLHEPAGWGLPLRFAAAAVLFLAGVPLCSRAAKRFGRKDPGAVVFDELAAFPLVFLAFPLTFTTGIAGFLWFRLFDIAKPWPIRHLENLPEGWGVMADDQMAGVYAGAALWLTMLFAGGG